jgi:hypothetical protein
VRLSPRQTLISEDAADAAPRQKHTLTPLERRRRKERRAWIPTVIIGGLIVVAVAVAVVIQIAGFGKIVPPAPGDSTFNLAGLRVINGSADAQVDVRTPLAAASVGLPKNADKKFGPFGNVPLELDLVGTGGTESIYVDSMRVLTHNGSVVSISTTTHNTGYAFIHDQLESYTVLGVTPEQLAAFENAMPNGAGGPTSHFRLAVGDGNALGVSTHVTVACEGVKGCTVATTTDLPQK